MPPTITTTHHHHPTTVNHHSPSKQNPKLLPTFLKPIIMFLILSIFLIFLSLAAIFLLNFLLAGSVLNRRRRHHHHTGLNNLPTFRYPTTTTTTSDDDCSICLEGFKQGDVCCLLPVCDHVFHKNCVDLWLKKVLNCPVCRRPVWVYGDRVSDPVVGDGDDDYKFLWAVGVGSQVVW